MKQKERALLMHLIEHKDEYTTSQELASELSLSDRTVRNYIQQLKELVEANGGEIIAKQGSGYQLKITHKLTFDLFLSRQDVGLGYEERPVIIDVIDRQNYLLNQLLLEEAVLNIDDLAEELYISRSSLSKDMQEIKEKLRPYSLAIVSKLGKGLWVVGKERDKRHFIMDTFFGKNYNNFLQKYLGNSQFFKDVSFEELTIIILDETREAKLKIADFVIQNLVLHLSLAIKRLQEGFEIKDLGIASDISARLEYQVAQKIVERIEIVTAIRFPEEEVSYLALHLMAKSQHKETDMNQELARELTGVITQLTNTIDFPLLDDFQLRNGLLDHLVPMLVRLERGITLENPLTAEIKQEHPQAFELTKQYFSAMPLLREYQVSDDEWAYLALHVMAALEKIKDASKVHALIICATGYGSAQLLKNRVINEFGKHITVTDVQGYYEISEDSLQDVDLIISSVDLSAMVFKVPALHVSVFLNDDDVHRIRQAISQLLPYRSNAEVRPLQPQQQKQCFYQEQLTADLFKVYEVPPTKEIVLQELLTLLSVNESDGYQEQMLKQMQHRETMGQIIFSDTVVVPHPALPVGVSTKIAVALIPGGMRWEAQDQIQFVFLISPSYIENEGITVITKAIVRLVDRPDIQQEILAEPTFANFNDHFLKII